MMGRLDPTDIFELINDSSTMARLHSSSLSDIPRLEFVYPHYSVLSRFVQCRGKVCGDAIQFLDEFQCR